MVTTASADGAVIMVNHIDGVLRSTGARVRPFPRFCLLCLLFFF